MIWMRFSPSGPYHVMVEGRVIATGTPAAISSNDKVKSAYLGNED